MWPSVTNRTYIQNTNKKNTQKHSHDIYKIYLPIYTSF